MKGDLYFVGHFKHGDMTHLVSGPFVDWEAADDDRNLEQERYSYPLKVVKTTLEFEVW